MRRVLLCSGKVYYDLLRGARSATASGAIARAATWRSCASSSSIRGRDAELAALLAASGNAERVVWVQEEPANMGAWSFVRERLGELLPGRAALAYAGREASASTAVGSPRVHREELEAFLGAAFAGL